MGLPQTSRVLRTIPSEWQALDICGPWLSITGGNRRQGLRPATLIRASPYVALRSLDHPALY